MDKEILKGSIDILLLPLMNKRDMYGYEMVKELKESNDEVYSMGEGTLFPAQKDWKPRSFSNRTGKNQGRGQEGTIIESPTTKKRAGSKTERMEKGQGVKQSVCGGELVGQDIKTNHKWTELQQQRKAKHYGRIVWPFIHVGS